MVPRPERQRSRLRPSSIPLLLLGLLAAGCGQRDPVLEVSTSEMDFGNQQTAQSFDVKNAGEDRLLASGVALLVYDIHADQEWVTIDPWWGKCDEGKQNAHVVEIDRGRLLTGSNLATLRINSNAGRWSITVRADNGGSGCSAPPGAPGSPSPSNNAAAVPIGADLMWNDGASQCPGLTATYDVYFGTRSNPPLVLEGTTSRTWDPGTLAEGTTYHWKIVARDANGSTPGPEWKFTTASASGCTVAPGAVTMLAPANGATAIPTGADLSWSGGNSQCSGLTATYEVYFGTSSPPPLHHDNGSAKSWDPGTLANDQTYYWRIVAKDANGTTSGPVWSFTTESACTAAPTAACAPVPADAATNVSDNANLAWGCGEACGGGAVNYDVYFGTNPTPGAGELQGSTATKAWNLPRLQKSTTYYWRIVTRDSNGTVPGPVWSFETKD